MTTEAEKEEIIKDSLSVMSERIPTIIEEAEQLKFKKYNIKCQTKMKI